MDAYLSNFIEFYTQNETGKGISNKWTDPVI